MRISTHAPLAGRDKPGTKLNVRQKNFNPRAPCGARHRAVKYTAVNEKISTHAPLAGRDQRVRSVWSNSKRFQPTRPLRGATGHYSRDGSMENIFQPTRPLRGATFQRRTAGIANPISTHAPLAGRDPVAMFERVVAAVFQPTRPLRGATDAVGTEDTDADISTHAPLAGRDNKDILFKPILFNISTHAPLAGRDSKSVQITMHIFAITDKFQMLLHRMPPVRAFCSFLMQENHADFGCEPPK